MRLLRQRRSQKAGLPPGTPVHIGEKKVEKTKITRIEYDEAEVLEEEIAAPEACAPVKGGPNITWINVDGLHEVETLQKIGECFDLHPLVVEDILNTGQRPKIEEYQDRLYIVLKTFQYDQEAGQAATEQVSIVLGPGFVLTFQESESGLFDAIKERIRNPKSRFRQHNADYLAYALVDLIVDTYFVFLEQMEDRIDALEPELMSHPTIATLRAIQRLKTEVLLLRKSVWPLREVTSRLARQDVPMIENATQVYLRDVYDHTIQALDTMESFRDILAGMLDVYLSSISNEMNAVMKVLTLIATIFIPLTLVVGIYGMNFEVMPELHVRWGYAAVWLAMVLIGGGMVVYFRKRRWL
jgi:magnesium transporter